MINIYLIGCDQPPILNPPLSGCRIIPFPVSDWDAGLTPWPAAGITKGRTFEGKAQETLECLIRFILDDEKANGVPEKRVIAGYSLAGLFSLWCMTRCDLFDRGASVSGSLWYDHWNDYLQVQGFAKQPERVWISVGDREKNTKNPRMKTVEDDARTTAELIRTRGIECRFERMPGGHFDHVDERIAQACRYLAERGN